MSAGEVSVAVEAGARAVAIERWDEYKSPSATQAFDDLSDYDREQWLKTSRPLARAAIDAALPHLSPRPDAEVCTCTPDQFAANQWHHFEECPLAPAPAPVDTLVEHAKACGGCHRCDFVPAPVDDRETLVRLLSDSGDPFPEQRAEIILAAGYVKGP